MTARARPAGRSRPGDDGYTLVELILSIAVLGIVMVALASVMFASLRADRETADRLDASRAQQFAATYLAADAQSARATADGVVSSGAALCGTGTLLVEFRGSTFDPAAVTSARVGAVAYVLRNVTAGGVPALELHRLACEAPAGSAAPLTPSSDITVARALSATGPQTVNVSGRTVVVTLTPLQGASFQLVGTRRTT